MSTVDAIWKAPVTAAEEFDRSMAQRLAAAAALVIPVPSLETYWWQWDDRAITEDVAAAPAALVDEFEALHSGQAHLRLPDGSRWVLVTALMPSDVCDDTGDNAFLRRLDALLWEHRALRECPRGPRRPLIFLDADILDPRHVFCAECRGWVDLVADAEESDRTLAPWEDA